MPLHTPGIRIPNPENTKPTMRKIVVMAAALLMASGLRAEDGVPASRIKFYGHLEAGITGNLDRPTDRQNFGRLFDDRANEPLLNQLLYTVERTLDPGTTSFDWGFKLQGMYGSDARFIHSTGLLDDTTNRILQPDLVEAYLSLHFPVEGTAGGVDVKVGKFVTLEGAEVIDSTGDIFYSHTYIFNFGIPFNHTGALATVHATKGLDVMVGVTKGVNTFKDNNDRYSFHGGFGLPSLAGGKLSLVLSTHIGPETANNNKDFRYLTDLVAIYKINDRWTSTTDLNHAQDDAGKAHGYGIAQYFTCAVTSTVTLNFRGEVWRDDEGLFVAQFGNNTDLLSFERGDTFTPDPRTVGGGATTYGAITFGATIKPTDSVTLRPEIRYDKSLNNTTPFVDSTKSSMLTFGVDVTYSF